MKKIIKTVTITGADDSIHPKELLQLSDEFPFVEWGILFSKSSEGKNRYPSAAWQEKLREVWHDNHALSFCGHICGRWVRDICDGFWTIYDEKKLDMFQRFQLNFHAQVHSLNKDNFIKGFSSPRIAFSGQGTPRQFIFQLDDVNNGILDYAKEKGVNAVPLFDLSGGAGRLPEDWHRATGYSGYAGGLSPDNLTAQLELIEQVAGDGPIWIDTETRVRSENDQQFDLDKVRRFLEISKDWVI
jgi:hypothetical protein